MWRKRKTFVILILAVLLIFTISLSFLSFEKVLDQNLQKGVLSTLSETAEQHKIYSECRLNGEYNVLKTLASAVSRQNIYETESLFSTMNDLADTTEFQCFGIVYMDGRHITNRGYEDNISDYEVFQKALKGEATISNPLDSLIDKKQGKIFLMLYPVIYKDEVICFISGTYEVADLQDVLSLTSFEEENYGTIIDSNGNIILSNQHNKQIAAEKNIFDFYETVKFPNKKVLPLLKDSLKHEREGSFSYLYKKEQFMAYYQPVNVNDWYLLNSIPVVTVSNWAEMILKSVHSLAFKCLFATFIFALYLVISLKKEVKIFRYKSEKDSMTDLYNKKTTERLIDQVLKIRKEESHALFIIDIDDFKGINDTDGHQVGDMVIIQIANLLKTIFRKEDIVGRIGGDEFAVLLKNVSTEDIVIEKAKEINLAFQKIKRNGKDGKPVSCSMGIAMSNLLSGGFMQLYQSADEALYRTKEYGKAGYHIYKEK